jgi:hypothetical protein
VARLLPLLPLARTRVDTTTAMQERLGLIAAALDGLPAGAEAGQGEVWEGVDTDERWRVDVRVLNKAGMRSSSSRSRSSSSSSSAGVDGVDGASDSAAPTARILVVKLAASGTAAS